MHSKGFVSIAVVILVVVLLAGGAVYFAVSPKKFAKESELPVPTNKEKFLSGEAESKKEEAAPSQPKVEAKPATSASSKKESHTDQVQKTGDPWKDVVPKAPINLALPLTVADIEEAEMVLSPYGIIRKSGDGGIGHGGIDFPLRKGSPIYSAADGVIIKNYLEDPGGGKTVDVLILPGGFQGEGWIFKYDHITLNPGLTIGSKVQKGQKIGTNAFEQRGNNHIGLEYHTRNFTIAREKICWVDRLEVAARQQLENAFDRVKKTPAFLQFWQTATAEGYYQYKGLLDQSKYPDGPRLCYPLGTDARISLSSGLVPTTQSSQNQKPILKNLGINIEPWDKKTNRAGDFLFENKNYVDNKIFTEFGHKIVNEFGEKLLPEIGFNVPVGTKIVSPIDGVVTYVKFYEPSQDYLVSIKTSEQSLWMVGFEHIHNLRKKEGDRIAVGEEFAEVSPSYGKTEFGNVEINVWTGDQNIFKYCPFEFLDDSLKPVYKEKINQLANDWEEFIAKDVYKQEKWVAPGCLLDKIQER